MANIDRMLLKAVERATTPPKPKKEQPRIIPVDSPKFQIKATQEAQTEEIPGEAVVIGRIKLSDEYLKSARKRARNG